MTGLTPIEYLKGYPAQIPVALKCLLSTQDLDLESKRWDSLLECLRAKLPTETGALTANIENLIHAQTLPTLRKLGFVTGEERKTRLTTRGWTIAKQPLDDTQLKVKVGAMLLDRDNDTWGFIPIVERLRKYPGASVPVYDLALGLARRGLDPRQRFSRIPPEKLAELQRLGATTDEGSRLSDTLKYYDYTDLLRRAGATVTLLDSSVQRASSVFGELVRKDVPVDDFFHELRDQYDRVSRRLGSSYVPIIPDLREAVCRDLKLDEDTFVGLLSQVVPTYGGHRLLLSPPPSRTSRTEMVQVRGRWLYYLSMFPDDPVAGKP